MAIAFVLAGTPQSGVGSITPTWPAHVVGDVALLIIQTTGGQPASLTTASGFAAVANSPQATGSTTAGSQVTVYWCRATSNAMAAPVVADSGNHQLAIIITFSGVVPTGNPWNVTAGTVKATTSTTGGVLAMTTTVPNTGLVLIITSNVSTANEYSGWTGSLTEVVDTSTASGVGGSIGVAWKTQAAAGTTGSLAVNLATTAINANLFIALKPALTQSVAAAITPDAAAFSRLTAKAIAGSVGGSVVPTVFQYAVGDSLVTGYSFARALAAYQVQSGGVLQLIATGIVRDADYSYGVRGLLLEPARVNYFLQSEAFSNVAWSPNSSGVVVPVVTANQTTDPVGAALSADKIAYPAVSSAGNYSETTQNPAGQSSAAKYLSVYLKGNAGGEILYTSTTPDGVVYQRAMATLITAWARYGHQTGTSNTYYSQFGIDLRDTSQAAQAAFTLFAWGAQLEDGPYPTSPIITTTVGSVSRPADVLTYTVPGGAGQVGTLYEKFYDMSTGLLVEQVSPLTTGTTFVPAMGRVWLAWKFALGTQVLADMQTANPSGALPLPGTLSSAKSGGGTNTPKSIAAGITPTAVLVRTLLRNLAALITPTGALNRKLTRAVAAASTPSGALARTGGKILTAVITPAATHFRKLARSLAATIMPSGSINRLLARPLTAANTPTAALSRTLLRALAASLTPSAALAAIRLYMRALIATVTPAGALSRIVGKLVGAIITPSRSLNRKLARALPATITPAGTLLRTLLRTVAGVLTLSGALVRKPARSLSATITPTATLARSVLKFVLVVITPSSALNRIPNRTLAANITPSAVLLRSFTHDFTATIALPASLLLTALKPLAAVIMPTALISRVVAKVLSGNLTPSGSIATGSFFNKAASATIAPSAALSRSTAKAMAAVIMPTAAILRETARSLAALISGSGVANRLTARAVSGLVTPSASVATLRSVVRTTAGTIAPSAGLNRNAAKRIAAILAPSAQLVRRTARSLGATIAPIAILSAGAQSIITVTAILTPASSLARNTARRLNSAITPSAQLVPVIAVRAGRSILAIFRAIR